MKIYTESAGGVVVRYVDGICQILLLRDRRYIDWTLPKGHVEDGESHEQTCRREVYEEAGVEGVIVHDILGTYTRQVKDTNEIKTIYYYLMTLTNPSQEFKKTPDNEGFEIKRHPLTDLPVMYLEEQREVIEKNRTIFAGGGHLYKIT